MPAPGDNLEEQRRNAMARNLEQLAAIGLLKDVEGLKRSCATATEQEAPKKKRARATSRAPRGPARRSDRLANIAAPNLAECDDDDEATENGGKRAKAVRKDSNGLLDLMAYVQDLDVQGDGLSEEQLEAARKRRDEVARNARQHDKTDGLTCHFCRQKILCNEASCKRCTKTDTSEKCVGKTACSRCQKDTGVFCRHCLLIRYGLELEEVRADPTWLCPHCVEDGEAWKEHGMFCNSSNCMKAKRMLPTGVVIYDAHEHKFKSVASFCKALWFVHLKKQKEKALEKAEKGEKKAKEAAEAEDKEEAQEEEAQDEEEEAVVQEEAQEEEVAVQAAVRLAPRRNATRQVRGTRGS